jgi:hypothetical protein
MQHRECSVLLHRLNVWTRLLHLNVRVFAVVALLTACSSDSSPSTVDAAVDSGAMDGGTDGGGDGAIDSQIPCSDAEVRNDAGACVECVADNDCEDPLKPTCGAGNLCVAGCDARTDCARFAGAPACHSSGECRQCDPGEETNAEAGDCGAKSCDPATWSCTTTDRGALNFCQTCVADSECKTIEDVGTYRCVNITWTVDGDRSGNYCVLDKATTSGGVAEGACPRQGQSVLSDASSANQVRSSYCSPRATITTCEAVLATSAGTACSVESPCAVGMRCVSGFCRLRCSDGADCADDLVCNPDTPRYCN